MLGSASAPGPCAPESRGIGGCAVDDDAVPVLLCYAPRGPSALRVNIIAHRARVTARDFAGFRYFDEVPHVAVLRNAGGLDLHRVPAAVARELLDDGTGASRRADLLADHVSDAFASEAVASAVARAVASVGVGPSGGLVRVSFDDLEAFMLASIRPGRRGGWASLWKKGSPERLAVPLVLEDYESDGVAAPHGRDAPAEVRSGFDRLVSDLAALCERTQKAAKSYRPFKGFYDTLGTTLYFADPRGALLVPAVAGELALHAAGDDDDDGGDDGGAGAGGYLDLLGALAAFPCHRRDAQPGGAEPKMWGAKAVKVRVRPGVAPEGSGVRPIDPVEVAADARGWSWDPRDPSCAVVGLSVMAVHTAADGTRHRVIVKQTLRDEFRSRPSVGHVEQCDRDDDDPAALMTNLALRACAEFVEEVGTHRAGEPAAVVGDGGVVLLHGRYPVEPLGYSVEERRGKMCPVLTFSADLGVDPCQDSLEAFVEAVAGAVCEGVPRDMGYESVGRRVKVDPVHPWGAAEARADVETHVLHSEKHGGSVLGAMLKYCMAPYAYPPADVLRIATRRCPRFEYASEDGFFAPPPTPAAASSPAVRPRLKLKPRTVGGPVGGRPGEASSMF